MQVFFICDESGAKGYADVAEKYPGESGVFAGYFVPEDLFETMKSKLVPIAIKHFGTGQKRHLRGLPPSRMAELRSDVFEFIKDNRLQCAYDAIYVEGFRQAYLRQKEMVKEADSRRTSTVKISNRLSPDSLHITLFEGLFCKTVSFFRDHYDSNKDELKILVDKVDLPALKGFIVRGQEILNFGSTVSEVTGWNPEENEVVKGTITMNANLPESEYGWMKKVKFDISESPEPFVMVADVIVNSLNYLFRQLQEHMVGAPLNIRFALTNHELNSFFYGVDIVPQTGSSDLLYMHPSEETRRGIKWKGYS